MSWSMVQKLRALTIFGPQLQPKVIWQLFSKIWKQMPLTIKQFQNSSNLITGELILALIYNCFKIVKSKPIKVYSYLLEVYYITDFLLYLFLVCFAKEFQESISTDWDRKSYILRILSELFDVLRLCKDGEP